VSDLLMGPGGQGTSPLAIASRRVVVQLPQVVEEGVALVLDLEVEVLEVDLEEEEVDGSVPPHAAG